MPPSGLGIFFLFRGDISSFGELTKAENTDISEVYRPFQRSIIDSISCIASRIARRVGSIVLRSFLVRDDNGRTIPSCVATNSK